MPTAVPDALCLEMSLPHHSRSVSYLTFVSELRVELTPHLAFLGLFGLKLGAEREIGSPNGRAISHADALRRPRDGTARDASAPPPCGAGHGGGASPPSYSRIDAPCEPTNVRVRSGAGATGSD